jgi:dolichol-phosphate mannosyltransferase
MTPLSKRSVVEISIVIPVFDEEKVLPQFFKELVLVLDGQLKSYGPVEVILVNDGSKDQSWRLIADACQRDSRFVGVNLSRNFGHQLALAAGLESARGRGVVTMDADLQDPPEVIVEMLAAQRRGYDVVYATRRERGEEKWSKRVTANLFYFVLDKVSGVRIPPNTGDFRLMSRRALKELTKLRESHRFLRGLVPWIGFPQTQIYYDRRDRVAGETHYTWTKMIGLAWDGMASMSKAPLRLAYVLSLFLFTVFIGYIIYVGYDHFVRGGQLVPGWTSIMSAITIFGAIQLLLFGVFGEYLGRVYEQVKRRPLYIIQEIRRSDSHVQKPRTRVKHPAASPQPVLSL